MMAVGWAPMKGWPKDYQTGQTKDQTINLLMDPLKDDLLKDQMKAFH